MARLGILSATILLLLLPVMVAFWRIDASVSPVERERVARALTPETWELSPTLLGYYRMTLPKDADAEFASKPNEITQQARRAGMWMLLAIGLELYVILLLSRGRTVALLGCLMLCAQPAVYAEGHLLRPEQPATVFVLLGALVFASLPGLRHARAGRRRRRLNMFMVVCCASLCVALAASCLASSVLMLFLPATASVILALQQIVTFVRYLRRGGRPERWPVRAATGQLAPWVLSWFAILGAMLMIKSFGGEPELGSPSALGLLPESWFAAVPCALLAAAGVVRLIWQIGFRERLHISATMLLFLFVALSFFIHLNGERSVDGLPMAVAMAALMAEGLHLLVFYVAGRWLSA